MKSKLIFILIITFGSCEKTSENNSDYTEVILLEQKQEHPGKKLLEVNCYVCHSPTAGHDERIAPPMIAVKKHYLTEGVTKEQFIKNIEGFIENPNVDDAKMYGAVNRFGVMPKANYSEGIIAQIADYIYDFELEEPEWFQDHFNKGKSKGEGRGKRKH